MKISDYINEERCAFLSASTKEEALKNLVSVSLEEIEPSLNDAFLQAILERENIVSTGIGLGIAVPHAKLPCFSDFFISIGILEHGVDWNALDNAPVRFIFLIGGPEKQQTEYLTILSLLTTFLRNEILRKKLRDAKNKEEVVRLFQDK